KRQRRAGSNGGGVRTSAKYKASDDEDKECAGLECGGDQLSGAPPLDATPLQDREAQQNNDGDGCVTTGERREKYSHVTSDYQRDHRVGAAGGDPVAPAHYEAGVFAERATGIIILSAAARDRSTELGKRRSAENGVETAENPSSEKQPYIRQLGGN